MAFFKNIDKSTAINKKYKSEIKDIISSGRANGKKKKTKKKTKKETKDLINSHYIE